MKNKLFKTVRPMLSIAVAVAILAVSLFAAVPGISFSADAATVTDTWDGTQDSNLAGSGTVNDPYKISTAEQLAYVALGTTFAESSGKYYKVIDNAVFNLNGMEDITLESDIGEVMAATPTSNIWKPSESKYKAAFGGHFDGNGIIVYNMYSANFNTTGLFPEATEYPADGSSATPGQLSFKNITLLNSVSSGGNFSGGIVGQSFVQNGSKNLAFENIKVQNCRISDKAYGYTSGNRTSGILAGTVNHANTTIKNCIAIDNITSATNISGGLIGNTSQWNGGLSVSNCIVVGSYAYPVLTAGSVETLHPKTLASGSYNGVYTTEAVDTATYSATQVKQVALNDMKGAAAKAAMPNLDWTKWVAFDGELPDYRDNHTLVIGTGDETGHKVTCSDTGCGKSMVESHTFIENEYGTMKECVCGYSVPVTDRSEDTWDGTFDENLVGSGTEKDPYIITTAEEMAYVALKITPSKSKDKYYKVAPYKVFNMNGKNGITLTSTAAQVKAASTNKNWTGGGDDGAKTFSGHFDGNGVVIYNIWSRTGYGALFPYITTENDGKNVSIKNITVIASYFRGYHFAGGIVGRAAAPGGGYTLTIENCAVKNCVMTDENNTNVNCSRTAAAIVGTVEHNSIVVNNCFALNNLLEGTDRQGGFVGDVSTSASDNPKITNSIIIGSSPIVVVGHNPSGNRPVTARVIAAGNFTNVYTDQYVKSEYNNKINKLELSMMTGVSAPQNMTELDYNSIWFANTGLIDLQICHQIDGSVNASDKYAGHNIACKVCNLDGVIISNHKYNDEYTCTVCAFECDHKNDEYIETVKYTLDCVTPDATGISCACGFEDLKIHEDAKGHDLVKTAGVDPDCIHDGNVEYYTCKECEKIFLTNDKFAPMTEAVVAAATVLKATGIHAPILDTDGKIVYKMENGRHYKVCKVCEAKYEKEKHTPKYIAIENNESAGHTAICEVCLIEVAESKPHSFEDNNEQCLDCGWICDHKDTVVAVEVSDTSCAAEGAKAAHHKCTVCDVRFADAAATQKIDKATVAIEKLAHKFTNIDQNGTAVQDYNDTHHWYNCSECGKFDYAEHTIVEDTESYEGVYKWCEDEKGYGCNHTTFDYSISNEDDIVTVTAPTNAFTKDVITDIFEISKKDDIYGKLEPIFKSSGCETFTAYEITPSETIASGKKANITIEIPTIYGSQGKIVFVDLQNGKLETLENELSTVYYDKKGNVLDLETLKATLTEEEYQKIIKDAKEKYFVSAATDKFGYFAVISADVVLDGENSAGGTQGGVNGDSSLTSPPTGDNVIFASTVIAILASATVLFVRKAKI